jgi:hypothetical protein
MTTAVASLDLFWLPLGAGGRSVRWDGRVYEAACALRTHRAARDLYHSALRIGLPGGSWTVEMTPVWAVRGGGDRGVVAEGAVGTRLAGHARLFRYEVHCWRDGTIADLDEAVGGPVRLSSDPAVCRRLLAVLPQVPRPVWGRDEVRAGEMWNSNSVTSWALTRSGLDASAVRPPGHGRAPGWAAGIVVATRQQAQPGPTMSTGRARREAHRAQA